MTCDCRFSHSEELGAPGGGAQARAVARSVGGIEAEPDRAQARSWYHSLDKPAKMVLLEAVRDGGKQLSVLPPLVIHGDDGRYTQQAIDIYFGAHGSGDD